MTFYTRLQNTAQKLLKDKGQAVTITTVTPGTYDPTKGTITNTSTTQAGYGAIFEYDFKNSGIYNAPGSLIQMGDKQLLLSVFKTDGTAITAPRVNETVTIGSVVYTITQVKPMAPAGTVVMYECNLRV